MFQFPRSTALVGVCLLVGSRNLFAQTYGVAVTPQGTTISSKTAHTTGYTYQFRVQNEGTTQQTWNLTCVGASNITCTNWPANVTLAAGAFQMITVTFSTANEGTGQLYLTASNAQSNDQGWVNVPVVLAAGAPRMSVLPYLEAKQDYARCAAACFAATYGQSTVPYFSLDQPRNVTLVYHGDRVDPKPFVAVDVFPDTTFGTWPSEYQFQVKVNGAFVTFANGETLLRFAGTTGSTRYRIGGQFTPSGLIHGKVYPMEILVTSKIGAAFYTNRWITQYLHLDEANSAIGRGWTLAGVQRAHIVADTGILINEGGGSATYFKYNPITAKYEAPSGEFSILSASGSTWVRAYPDSTKVVFNSAGLMVRVADRWGVRDTLIYDGSNRLTQLRDPVNNTITLGYGANGLSSIQDPFGRTTAITVQANKTLTAIQDPDLVSTTFGYDGSLRLLRITDRAGQTDTLAYDSQSGKLSSLKAPQIRVYGGSLTNPVTSFSAWQKVGIPYVATAGTAYGPARADTVYGRVTEPGGTQTTRFTVNRWGSPAVTTNPLSEVTTVTYTVQGQPAKVVAPGYGTAFDTLAYNGSGLLTFQRTVKDSGTTIVYGAAAQPVHIYGPLQDSTHAYLSGTAGKLDSVKVGGQVVQRITSYDAYGRPVTVKDGVNTIIATYAYFTSGTHRNLNSVTLPGSRVTTYAYDTYGRSVTATPPSGTLAQHTRYDALNRVLADSIPTPGTPTVTRYQYDNMHRVTQVTDPKSQVYQYAYNAVGWLARSLDPVNGKDTLQYDPNGDLRRHTNRRAQNIDFTYDALHRPLSRTGSASVSWSYTSNGYTVTATSTASTETTYLGIRGVTDSIKTVLNGQTYWRRYQYTNGTALLDTVTVTGPGGVTFRGRKYLYNVPKGILTTIRLGGRTTTINVDANFNPTGLTLPDNQTTTYTQGTLQTPIKDTTTASYNFTVQRWLGLNNLGQIDKHHTYPNAKFGRWFQFDSLGRVRVAKNVQRNPEALPGGCPNPDFGLSTATCTPPADYLLVGTPDTMAYDPVGNRLDKGGSYTTGNRITAFNNCTYSTDADGNVTGRSGGSCASPATFYWNKEGQLDSMIAGANRVHLLYDADGRLVQKKLNGTSQAYFLWDGANLLAELNGTATAKVAEYSYYPGLDNLHALVVGGSAYYAHEDFLGNVIALTDSAQGVKRTYGYDDWGKLTSGSDNLPFSNADRARWKGALWLGPEVDVYYMRNRWYETGTGRFLSEDPIGLAGGINPLVFANGDPVGGADPEGLVPGYAVDPWGSWRGRWGTIPYTPLGLPRPPGTQGELLKRAGGGGGSMKAYNHSPISQRPTRTPQEVECREAKLELGAAMGSDALVLLPLAKAFQLTVKSGRILATVAGKGAKAGVQRGAARAFIQGRSWVDVAMVAEAGNILDSQYALIGNSEEFTWRTAISWVPIVNSGLAAWDAYLACK